MTLKIKYRLINDKLKPLEIIEKGEYIDLYSAEDVVIEGPKATKLKRVQKDKNRYSYRPVEFQLGKISLGIAMQLPKGYKADIVSRSSTPDSFGIIQKNAPGIVDASYSGNEDIWKYSYMGIKDGIIKRGDKICQFSIGLSQKATVWQKIKWLFTNKIEFIKVDHLDAPNRGGFGTTGTK